MRWKDWHYHQNAAACFKMSFENWIYTHQSILLVISFTFLLHTPILRFLVNIVIFFLLILTFLLLFICLPLLCESLLESFFLSPEDGEEEDCSGTYDKPTYKHQESSHVHGGDKGKNSEMQKANYSFRIRWTLDTSLGGWAGARWGNVHNHKYSSFQCNARTTETQLLEGVSFISVGSS